jgi:hypothetical protein
MDCFIAPLLAMTDAFAARPRRDPWRKAQPIFGRASLVASSIAIVIT